MGAVYTPICGTVLCGQTKAATWRAVMEKPTTTLGSRTFSISIVEGPFITISLNRAVLVLEPRALALQTSSRLALTAAKLEFRGKPFVIQPFLSVALAPAKLLLRPKTLLLSASIYLPLQKAVLNLLAHTLSRAGRAGLIPTVPVTRPLVPTDASKTATIVPTSPSSSSLVATAAGTQPLQPTVDEDDVLLVPTLEEVR